MSGIEGSKRLTSVKAAKKLLKLSCDYVKWDKKRKFFRVDMRGTRSVVFSIYIKLDKTL